MISDLLHKRSNTQEAGIQPVVWRPVWPTTADGGATTQTTGGVGLQQADRSVTNQTTENLGTFHILYGMLQGSLSASQVGAGRLSWTIPCLAS